jgi:L-threonylcarbamoyladenylate synthase
MINEEIIQKCINLLSRGQLIVYPTDTLYGIGADIFNNDAIKKVFKIKNRPYQIPLPIAVDSISSISKVAEINNYVIDLAEKFLPGPLTLILKKNRNISNLLTNNKDTIAVRIPNDKIALKILKYFGPLTITSANIHNKPTPSTVDNIRNLFKVKDISLFIDDGLRSAKPSTIVDITEKKPKILRPGVISSEEIYSMV